jgi:hypothetical protein
MKTVQGHSRDTQPSCLTSVFLTMGEMIMATLERRTGKDGQAIYGGGTLQ